MCEEEAVHESAAAYYQETSKKWQTGVFKLYENYILFSSNEDQVLKIPLKNISGLEKRQSSLIYAAIVISIGAEKYWFASFPNRDSLYNLIELFWREALLSTRHIPSPEKPKPASSDLGKELLGMLHESEVTLINAANALSDQGKQIEETQATIDDINSDLDVAERFLHKMSSISSLFQRTNASIANVANEADILKCFKVSYLVSETVTDSSFWDKGTLFIDKEFISISNDKKTQDIILHQKDVISCEIVTPCKLQLNYRENNTEKSLYIMCPKLPKLLKYLNASFMENKIQTNVINIPSTSFSSCSSPSTSGSINALLSSSKESYGTNSSVEQLQEELISDADIEEISNVLNNLQTLAAEVSREQKDQLEKIDALRSTSETTEIRMKADTNKIKKLI